MPNRLSCFLLTALATTLVAPAGAIDVVGQTEVVLQWDPASGPVVGYYVVVSRDGADPALESLSSEPSETLAGLVGETLVVQVAAFDAEGTAGPMSDPSEPIRFLAADPGDGSDPGDPPPGEPGSETSDPSDPTDPPPGGGLSSAPMDFSCDGRSDLLIEEAPGALSIWIMDGSRVSDAVALPVASSDLAWIGAGDYDGDGCAELLWQSSSSGSLRIWELAGGAFQEEISLPTRTTAGARLAGSRDVDGDGTEDLLFFDRSSQQVEVLLMQGSAVRERTTLAGRGANWILPGLIDVVGDGSLGLLWQDILGRGLELDSPDSGHSDALGGMMPGWRIAAPADLDGDGLQELLLTHAETGQAQSLEIGTDGLGAAHGLPSPAGLGHFGAIGDFDGDGLDDVAWSDPAGGRVSLWLAGGVSQETVSLALPAGADLATSAHAGAELAYERFCDADLDDDLAVDGNDYSIFRQCIKTGATGECLAADFDSDGAITQDDRKIFLRRFGGEVCSE